MERKPLQLREITRVPSWERSVGDKRGLWIWRTSGALPLAQLLSG